MFFHQCGDLDWLALSNALSIEGIAESILQSHALALLAFADIYQF